MHVHSLVTGTQGSPVGGNLGMAVVTVKLQLLTGDKTAAEEQLRTPRPNGAFQTMGLNPGIYTLRATTHAVHDAGLPKAAQRQIILAPNPFNW